ncbi:MAG: PBP1A family penicillin-binding protein, partial [bacterium]
AARALTSLAQAIGGMEPVHPHELDSSSGWGIDPRGMVRALVTNLQKGDLTGQGASTITQQLVRNLYLSPQKKFLRKLQEIIIALRIEKKYSKEEIMTFYLNEVYLGSGANGVQTAAFTYFGKPVSDLSIAECALLAGLTQRPSHYSPFRNMDAAVGRRNVVLSKMRELGFITEAQYDLAQEEPVTLARAKGIDETGYKALDHPWFSKDALEEAISLLGENGARQVYFGGLRIYTTMDPSWQQTAEDTIKEWLPKWEKQKVEQASLVAIDPHSGAVRALVGGKDFTDNEFSRATQAKRQPGSSFKPFVYMAAIEAGYSPESLCFDSPRTFTDDMGKEYTPHNYDSSFMGVMTMRQALAMSRNVVAVMAADLVGVKAVQEVANKAGIRSPLPPYLSLALGAGEVSLIELTNAYATLAARGVHHAPYLVETILDARGQVLFQRRPEDQRVFEQNDVDLLNSMLQAVVTGGTGNKSRIDRPSAGKTGTTSDFVDAWFMGFTPDLCTGVWVGRDDNTPMARGVTGGHFPAYIWRDFMSAALAGRPVQQFAKPKMPRFVQALDPILTQDDLGIQKGEEAPVEAGAPEIDPESGQPEHKVPGEDGGADKNPPPIFF